MDAMNNSSSSVGGSNTTDGIVGDDWLALNVGGKIFQTSRSTLCMDPNSVLFKMFDKDSKFRISKKDNKDRWLIDRDPAYFRVLLNYLRSGTTNRLSTLIIDDGISIQGVLEEAQFFQINGLVELINNSRSDFTRKDILLHKSQIKLSNKRLMNIDLSMMDFTKENFNHSTLSFTNFESSKLSSATLLSTVGICINFNLVQAENAIMSGSNLSESTFIDANLSHVSFNNCKLVDTNFEGAKCTGALFQRAKIMNGSFKNTNLEHAKFQKATLSGCDFSGAELSNCHFTSADLRDAKFDWKKIFSQSSSEGGLGLFKKSKITPQQLEAHIPQQYKNLFKVMERDETKEEWKLKRKSLTDSDGIAQLNQSNQSIQNNQGNRNNTNNINNNNNQNNNVNNLTISNEHLTE